MHRVGLFCFALLYVSVRFNFGGFFPLAQMVRAAEQGAFLQEALWGPILPSATC